MAIPTIPNQPRSIIYTPVNSAGPFSLQFVLYDATGADLKVTLNGVVVTGWTLSAAPSPDAPNTWINGSITFAAPISGTLRIAGHRAPRRVANYAEGRGIPARDQNTEWNILTAVDRELYEQGEWHEARITELEETADDHEGRIDALESTAADHEARIGSLESQVAALFAWVTAQIAALQAWVTIQINALQAAVTSQLNAALATMQGLLAAAKAAAAEAASWALDARASSEVLAQWLGYALDMGDQTEPEDPDPFDLGEQGT